VLSTGSATGSAALTTAGSKASQSSVSRALRTPGTY
jgi:hypothetical protein